MPEDKELVSVFIPPILRTRLIRMKGELIAREGRMDITYGDVIGFLLDQYKKEPVPPLDPLWKVPYGQVVGAPPPEML